MYDNGIDFHKDNLSLNHLLSTLLKLEISTLLKLKIEKNELTSILDGLLSNSCLAPTAVITKVK